jgi:hypothetical protein
VRIAVFGSTGRVGRLIVAQALDAGHEVTAFARNPSELRELRSGQLRVVTGELSNRTAIERAIANEDVVISALGPSGRPTGTQLSDGIRGVVEAMQRQGVRRLIVLSTASVGDPEDRFDVVYATLVAMIRILFRDAHGEIVRMGDIVRSSDTDWTLVRIGLLNEGPLAPVRVGHYGRREVRLGVSAASLARFMLDLASAETGIGESLAISN